MIPTGTFVRPVYDTCAELETTPTALTELEISPIGRLLTADQSVPLQEADVGTKLIALAVIQNR